MAGATRSIVVNATQDKVFDMLVDYDRYGSFIPEVRRIQTSARNGSEVLVHYEVEVIKRIKYTLKMREERPHRLSWTFVEGEVMKDNKGEWLLAPEGEGRTKVTYSIEMALGPFVPKSIVNALVENSLPKMLEAFRREAESRP